MKKYISVILLLFLGCSKSSVVSTYNISNATTTPDKIVVVFWENHPFDSIRGNYAEAPYVNSLADSGTVFLNSYGVTHPSQPNYIAFFSGSQQGVSDDKCLSTKIKAANLYSKLKAVGKTCADYSEDLPSIGSTACNSGSYVRKHNPISDFKGISDSANKPFNLLPTDFSTLENLTFIIPNLDHDMHNGTITQADNWLRDSCGALIAWLKANNGILIITTDEDDKTDSNHIFTIAYGQHVLSGNTVSALVDHYNFTKTICSLLGASTGWTDSLKNRTVIKNWLN